MIQFEKIPAAPDERSEKMKAKAKVKAKAKTPEKTGKKRGRPPKGKEAAQQKSMRSPSDKMMRHYETK